MNESAAIHVRGVWKSYGSRVALRGVDLSVAPGEVHALLGPNGAGKTTLVEIIEGLRHRDGGEVTVLGRDPARDAGALVSRLGAVLQRAALPDRITVAEAAHLFARFHADPRDPDELLDQFALGDRRDRLYSELSGGERQRLFATLALLGRPEVAILDELSAGLDPEARRRVWQVVADLRDSGAAVLLVTHDLREATELSETLSVLRDGEIVVAGRTRDVVSTGRDLESFYLKVVR